MKNDLTTGAWQHDIGCPISITLLSTSDVSHSVGWDQKRSRLHGKKRTKLPQFGGGAMRELWFFLLNGFKILN
jgi:hypothetical protein